MKYKKGYKYQLFETEHFETDIKGFILRTDWIQLRKDGFLTIHKGYAWDGPSGPTLDTESFMRGSLLHDALYELLRKDLLPSTYKETADKLLIKICMEDGMSRFRRWWVYEGLSIFGKNATKNKNKKKVYETRRINK